MEHPARARALQSGEAQWEYVLVAQPPQDLLAMIRDEKKGFDERFGREEDRHFFPHITVAGFFAKEAMEETFIRWIQNICNLQKSFTVTLNNYSAFPGSGLYLRVQDAEPFRMLAGALRMLDGFMNSNDCPSLQLATKPHLSFVKGLPEGVYNEAVDEYSRKVFHQSFRVDKLMLLKNDEAGYQHINTFILPSTNSFK